MHVWCARVCVCIHTCIIIKVKTFISNNYKDIGYKIIFSRIFGHDHDCNLDEVLKEIAYFRGTAYYIKEFCFSGDLDCPTKGYQGLADMVSNYKFFKLL